MKDEQHPKDSPITSSGVKVVGNGQKAFNNYTGESQKAQFNNNRPNQGQIIFNNNRDDNSPSPHDYFRN